MIDHTTYHGIGHSISTRALLVSELAKTLASIDERDAQLREVLLQKAPEELRLWLVEDAVLTYLFRCGKCDSKINFNSEYGFTDLADVTSKMKALSKSWKDVVHIQLSDNPEIGRVSVYLSAIL